MSYSASDFVETITTLLNVAGDEEDFVNHANIMVAEIERLQRFERDIKRAASVLNSMDKEKLTEHILQVLEYNT